MSTVDDNVPVYSTPEETQSFNEWYEAEVVSKKSSNVEKLDSFPRTTSTKPPEDDLYDEAVLSDMKFDESLHSCDCHKDHMHHQIPNQVPNMVNLQAVLVMMIATSQLMIGQLRNVSKIQPSRSPSSRFPLPNSLPFLPSKTVPDPVTSLSPMETAALKTRTREEILSLVRDLGSLVRSEDIVKSEVCERKFDNPFLKFKIE